MINLKKYKKLLQVKELLAECVYSEDEKVSLEYVKYMNNDKRELWGKINKSELIALIGIIHISNEEVELKHIAVKSEYRKKGIGRDMIYNYIETNDVLKMVAETDKDAVNFYKSIGFNVVSLGEKYPGVERFRCTYYNNLKVD